MAEHSRSLLGAQAPSRFVAKVSSCREVGGLAPQCTSATNSPLSITVATVQLSQHCHAEPPGPGEGRVKHPHPVPHPKYSHRSVTFHETPPPPRWSSYVGHLALSLPLPRPSPPCSSQTQMSHRRRRQLPRDGSEIWRRKKFQREQGGTKSERRFQFFFFCAWARGGPLLSAICRPLPGESATSLPRGSAAGRQRAAEEVHRLSTAASKSSQSLLHQ